jgi:phage/plasmid-associated DNA primase
MSDFIAKAIAEKLIVVSSRNRIVMKQNKDGEWKKDCQAVFSGIGLSHKKIKTQMYKEDGKTHLIRTGKDSGVIGLDFDEIAVYDEWVKKYPELRDYITIRTRQGVHIYAGYSPEIQQTTNIVPGLDIRNEGGLLFCPPTKYQNQDDEEMRYEVLYCNSQMKFKKPLPRKIVAALTKDLSAKKKRVKAQIKNPENRDAFREELRELENSNPTDIHGKFLDIIDVKFLDNYHDYFKIVVSCSHREDLKEACRNACKKSRKFDDAAFERDWTAYQGRQTSGLGTIEFYARLSDPKKYWLINQEREDIFKTTDYDIATCFLRQIDDELIYEKEEERLLLLDKKTNYWIDITRDTDVAVAQMVKLMREYYEQGRIFLLLQIKTLTEDDDADIEGQEAIKLQVKMDCVICNYNRISSEKGMTDIMKVAKRILKSVPYHAGIKFDNIPYLLPFGNGVLLDIKKNEIRKVNKDDYIIRHTGTEYSEPEQWAIDKCRGIINQILPTQELYKQYLTFCVSGLTGVNPEKLIMAFGEGGNGKSKINNGFMKSLLGNASLNNGLGFYYQGKMASLMEKNSSNSGPNPELANLNMVRTAIFSEPPKNGKLSNNTIKELAGGDELNARACFSNKTRVKLHCSPGIEANALGQLDDADNGLERRIMITDFPSYFSEGEHDRPINPDEFVFPRDNTIDEFAKNNANAFLALLREHLSEVVIDDKGLDITQHQTEQSKIASRKFVARGNDILNWFEDTFEKTGDKTDYITFQTAFSVYKEKHQRKINKAQFEGMITDNYKMRKFYVANQPGPNSIYGHRTRKFFWGFKMIDDVEEEECEDI